MRNGEPAPRLRPEVVGPAETDSYHQGVDRIATVTCWIGDKDARARTLPLPERRPRSRGGPVQYRIAAVDHRGRMAEASLMRLLGWGPGEQVEVVEKSGIVLVHRHPRGSSSLTRRGHVQLPLATRRWCGVDAGDRLLLAAVPDFGVLLVHTMAALDDMVRSFHSTLRRDDKI